MLLDDGTERRPAVLTVYEYAGGALRFERSDMSFRPALIERVELDIAAALAALQDGGKS